MHLSKAYDFIINPENEIPDEHACRDNFLLSYQSERRLFLNTFLNKNKLTNKEIECVKLLTEGKSAKEIAVIVKLSFRTIEDRIKSLKLKFNAKNKSDLIAKLVRWL